LIAISDASRDDPRQELLTAILSELPRNVSVVVAVANGTHGPCDTGRLGLDDLASLTVVNHDAHDIDSTELVGTTRRGTPVRVNRCVLEADLVIATGVIKPHYFAGYGAGVKAVFPGLGENASVRTNHELKREESSRAGVVDGNPCREDLEEALGFLPPVFLLNVVRDAEGAVAMCVAGDPIEAFRRGVAVCDELFRNAAPKSRALVVSDHLPVTASLYQASKLVAAAAPLLEDRGTMIIAAECPEGVGPVDVVNHGIYEIGLRPRLPDKHQIVLVSAMSEYRVATTYCQWAPTIESVLARLDDVPTVIPSASAMILEPIDA
jgi:nickel-dependent lactate racemase